MYRLTLENQMYIDIQLFETKAPITTENFKKLVDEKFYDKIVFHRIIKDFMVQTGGYILNGNEISYKEAKSIKGEFQANGVKNDILHKKGIISMARTNDPNSGSSQFFICTADCPHLDGQYAAFGQIVGEESFKTLDYLNDARTVFVSNAMSDFPYPEIRIESIRKI